jgi:hypothetical protein
MDLSCLASLLELIGNNHIRPIYVVSHYLRPYDAADYGSRVDADTHVQAIECWLLLLYLVYLLQHVECEAQDVLGLFYGIPVIAIGKTQYDIAVSYGVDLIDIFFSAKYIELLEKTPKHPYYVLWLLPILLSI